VCYTFISGEIASPDKENTMLKQVEMPANETAWLRENARKGAVIITRNGERNAYTGHALTLTDSRGTTLRPVFESRDTPKRSHTPRPTRPMLD